MISLPEISVRSPVFAWMLMAAIIIFGSISFHFLGVSKHPDVDFPVVNIYFHLSGAAPEVIESQILDPVEDSIMQIDGVRNVNSTAQQSSGAISVEFEVDSDIDVVLQRIKNRVSQAKNLLPANLPPPIFRKTNPEDLPIMWVGLSSDDPNTRSIDMMIYAKTFLQNQISIIPGVGNITLGGYVEPALRVWLDLERMNRFDITSDDVLEAIKKEQIEIPAGQIQNEKHNYNIRILGETVSPDEFGKIRILSRQGQGANYKPLLLNQIATMEEGTADVRRLFRMNGKRALGVGIIKQHGSNAVQVANAVRVRLREIGPLVPKPFHLEVLADNTSFIKQSIDQLLFVLFLSALLTSLVCYFFLGSWAPTINILMAIPTSIIGTFIGLYFFKFTLNTFTLLGLSLAIGVVVDDAIMILENIVRHRELQKKQKEAAIDGANEITLSAFSATTAVVAIFFPIIFTKGIIGHYLLQYGVTVTIAVLLSLLEALTLTPMRCSTSLAMRDPGRHSIRFIDIIFSRIEQTYRALLQILLAHRWKALLVALVLFIVSLSVAHQLPRELIPPQDQGQLILRFKLPVGSALGVTDKIIKKVETYLLSLPEVSGFFTVIGGPEGDVVNQGMAYVNLVNRSKRQLSQADFIKKVRNDLKGRYPGVETIVQDLSLSSFGSSRGFPVEFVVQGPDWDRMTQFTDVIMQRMRDSGYVVDVNADVQKGMREIRIVPNRSKLAMHAVSVSTVTNVLNTLMGGYILNGMNEYSKLKRRYEIVVRLMAKDRTGLPDLRRVMIRNNRGQRVNLSDLVDEQVGPALLKITRLNRYRAITIYGNPAPGHTQQEAMKVSEKLARSELPQGYFIKMTGSSQSFRESLQSLVVALIFGIIISYMVLSSQFNSFVHSITVLTVLPFSLTGAFIGLALGHQSINIYSILGCFLLIGIVKKNSILLVDFTNQCRDIEKNVDNAILRACPIRLRPILMTSAATIAGALPEAASWGPGSEVMTPMAIAIIGGVCVSTVLTLFVTPCIYSLMSKLE